MTCKDLIWTETSLRRVMPGDRPPGRAEGLRQSLGADLEVARGGHASFQILVRCAAGTQIRDLRVETGDLVCRGRRGRLAAEHIEWHQVGFVQVDPVRHPHKLALPLVSGWHPDPLLPVERMDVFPEFTRPVWVTVHAPPDTSPGLYEGRLVLRAHRRESVVVRLAVRVFNVILAPGAGHLRTSFDLIEGFLEQIHGARVPARIARRYGEFLLKHRLNPDHFSRNEPPRIADLRHYRKLGLNSFCAVNLARHRGSSIRGGLNSPPEWYTEANWEALARKVDPFIRALRREKDLWPLAYVHGFDERDIDTHGAAMRLFFGRARERWNLPTLTTAHLPTDPAVLKGLQVDWLCPIWAQYHLSYNLERAKRARAAGLKVWSYISLEPYAPFPNWRLDSPLIEARTIWWQVFNQDMDGFLYWGLNVWDRPGNGRAIIPAKTGPLLDFRIGIAGEYDWLHGDGVLLYPGPDGPFGSIRLANIRDGLEDYELLWQLAEVQGSRAGARRLGRPVAAGLGRFTHDPRVVLRRRGELLRQLELHGPVPPGAGL